MTNSTVLELFSGQVYNIVVNAANALGVSQNISKEYTTLNMGERYCMEHSIVITFR